MSELSLAATAVGSLPHNTPEDATTLVWESFNIIPFWPQLSNVNSLEDMIIQYSQNIPGLVVNEKEQTFSFDSESEEFYLQLEEFYLDYDEIITEKNYEKLEKYAITTPYASTIEPFCEKLRELKPKFAKGQVIGPFSWGTSICDSENKCLFYEDTYRDIIVKGLTLKALWQIQKIRQSSPQTTPIIFMDEPTLGQVGTSAFLTIQEEELINSLKEISTVIQEHGGLSGIHCCGKTDWNSVLKSGTNILSFDAYSFHKNLTIYSQKIKDFLENGGYIAWGIVPTLDKDALCSATFETLLEKLEIGISSLEAKGISKDLILKQSIITPSCGAGCLSVELAQKAMELTSTISKHLKAKHKGI